MHSTGATADASPRATRPTARPSTAGPRTQRALERRVMSVLESVTHAFLAIDPTWRVTYANREAARLNGTEPDALIGRDHWALWPDTVGSEVERQYRAVAATREPAHFVHHYDRIDVWHEIHVYASDGGGLAVLFRDITDERRAVADRDRLAAALAEREHELARLLENATDVIARCDAHRRFTYANPAVERLTGIPTAELIGHTATEVGCPSRFVSDWESALQRVLTSGCNETLVLEYPSPDGPRQHEARIIAERDGDTASVLVIARDVTARVAAERAREQALAEAQEARAAADLANRAKSTFLANMSHELRTPLNAIRGYAELLAIGLHGPVTEEQREVLGRIQRSERHLLGLIGDILDFARLETGRMAYVADDVSLRTVVQDVTAVVETQARAKHVHLQVDETEDLCVSADARRLRQVVINLLSNAVKFTPEGGYVTLRCVTTDDAATIEVEDTGPGIAPEHQERIFEPFVQLGRSRANPVTGTGLGLSISRELARGMGGELTVRSAPGVGSTFALRLPITRDGGPREARDAR